MRHTKSSKGKLEKRLFTANGEEQFMNELAMFDWSNIYNSDDSNMQYKNFTTAVSKLMDKHFPLKKIRMNYNFETLGLHQELLEVLKEKTSCTELS